VSDRGAWEAQIDQTLVELLREVEAGKRRNAELAAQVAALEARVAAAERATERCEADHERTARALADHLTDHREPGRG
jgi:septal ring factor EnvC (AmiA/AmiB activator)